MESIWSVLLKMDMGQPGNCHLAGTLFSCIRGLFLSTVIEERGSLDPHAQYLYILNIPPIAVVVHYENGKQLLLSSQILTEV